MKIANTINQIESYKTAIESLEVLISDHKNEILKPTVIFLREQKKILCTQLSEIDINNIEVSEYEELSRFIPNMDQVPGLQML